jgi:hypothetical protein
VSTTTILQHQLTHVGLAAAVQNGLAGGKHGVLLLHAPQHVDGDIALWKQRINHEAVGGKNGLFVAQVQHHQVLVDRGTPLHLRACLDGMVEIEIDAFDDVRQFQNIRNAVVAAVLDQVHHQLVVADAELAEAPQAGARIHQVVQQHPILGIEDFLGA